MKAFKRNINMILYITSMILLLIVSTIVFNVQGNASSKVMPLVKPPASGTITGAVRFSEKSPEPEKITITKDEQICGTFKYSKSLVVAKETRGLKNVVVSLVSVNGKPTVASRITLDQKDCEYLPHVQAVPVGSRVEILNSDGILHNVHAYFNGLDPKDTVFNKAQPKFLKKISQTLDRAGTYYFNCDVHNHMSAFIVVLDHPYYALTDEDGSFTVADVPAGSYMVQAWHEVLGTKQKAIQVEAGKSSTVMFDMPPKEEQIDRQK